MKSYDVKTGRIESGNKERIEKILLHYQKRIELFIKYAIV